MFITGKMIVLLLLMGLDGDFKHREKCTETLIKISQSNHDVMLQVERYGQKKPKS